MMGQVRETEVQLELGHAWASCLCSLWVLFLFVSPKHTGQVVSKALASLTSLFDLLWESCPREPRGRTRQR